MDTRTQIQTAVETKDSATYLQLVDTLQSLSKQPYRVATRKEWLFLKGLVHQRDHNRCRAIIQEGRSFRLCLRGREEGAQLQCAHIVARKKGGSDHIDNLITKCTECHAREHPFMLHYQRGTTKSLINPVMYKATKDMIRRSARVSA